MTCKEAESLVMPYIRHELDVGQMEEFLEHIDGCANSDTDTDRYNIKGDMEADIISSKQEIYKARLITILHYAADTLMVMSLVVMLILQARIWWQTGIF